MQRREHHQGKGTPLQRVCSQWLPKESDQEVSKQMNYKARESGQRQKMRELIPYAYHTSKDWERSWRSVQSSRQLSHWDVAWRRPKLQQTPINTKGVVYKIPCEYWRMYVGKTRRTLKQRVTEHKWAVKNADSNNGLTVHVPEWIMRSDAMKL